jgi:hypothetical protein
VSIEEPAVVERPEDEDYDLLTYGEVAARLAEVIAAERGHLAELQAAVPPDAAAVGAQETRIAELVAARERYERQAASAETFMKRFGLAPRSPD